MVIPSLAQPWLSLLGLGLLLAFARPAVAECSKSVRWSDDPPYTFKAADGHISGVNADLAREALQRLGCTARFIELPWARGLNNLKKGSLDILPGTLRTPEREAFAFFSRPANLSPNVLFVSPAARSNYHFQRLADMPGTGFRLGVQIDVNYGADYQALLQNQQFHSQLIKLNSRLGAWQMIKAGRLDGLIADEITGLLELQRLGLSQQVVRSDVVVSGEPAHFALSRRSVDGEFVAAFDQALESMLADGSYQRILETYLPCQASAAKLGCE